MKQQKLIKDGLVVIFEGLDGAGKTSQIQLARQSLEQAGYNVYVTRNLGGSPIGEALRELLFSNIERPALTNFYIGVAVQEALIEVIEEQRKRGAIILIDRGPPSLVAYQSFGSGVDQTLAWHYADHGMKRFRTDLLLFYDLDISTALKRASIKHADQTIDYFEKQPMEYFKRVNKMLKQGAVRYSATSIDASKPIEKVHDETMASLDQLISDAANTKV